MDYIILICSAIAALLLFAIILQIIYIRIKLVHFEKDMGKKVVIEKQDLNYINIYAIKINKQMCNTMNNPGSRYFDNFTSLINTGYNDTILPYVCTTGIQNINVTLKRSGLLCLNDNESAARMADDCINHQLSYIVLNNIVFRIFYDPIMNEKIKDFCRENYIIDDGLTTSYTFTLYSINDHYANGDITKEECSFNISSFIGKFQSNGFNNTIDLNNIIRDISEVSHLIGYRVLG
jgi:hypothetical protein